MVFNWQCYLTLAEKITGDNTFKGDLSEAAKRTAISRAYYAAFHFARNYIVKNNHDQILSGKRDEHTEIPKWLQNHRFGREGSLLFDLKQKRHDSDYKSSANITDQLVFDAIQESKDIIEALSKNHA